MGEHVADARRPRLDLASINKRIKTAGEASSTALTELHGVASVVAAGVLGHVHDVTPFGTRAEFAGYNGTAPIKRSSASRERLRLNRRGDRQLNHPIDMITVTQVGRDITGAPTVCAAKSRDRPAEKRCELSASDLRRGLAATPDRRAPRALMVGRDVNQGVSESRAASWTLNTGTSEKSVPGTNQNSVQRHRSLATACTTAPTATPDSTPVTCDEAASICMDRMAAQYAPTPRRSAAVPIWQIRSAPGGHRSPGNIANAVRSYV